jgi:hypothetical protein
VASLCFGTQAADALQRQDRLQKALAQWSATHDVVLCDLPPLLLGADAELMIERLG